MIWVIYLLIILLIIVAWVGVFLPNLPGSPLIFLSALIFGWSNNFEKVSPKILLILGGLAVFSVLMDFLSSIIGAKKFGASHWSAFASAVGGLLGLIAFNFIGLILGIFLGAFIVELVFGESGFKKSLKVGIGSLLGFITGIFLQVFIALVMTIIFLTAIF